MRVLIISNFYPPAHLGGMELRLSEVVSGLKKRGHEVRVLTSSFRSHALGRIADDEVCRVLPLESDVFHYQPLPYLTRQPWVLRSGVMHARQTLAEYQPDVIFIWGMWLLSPAFAQAAELFLPGRTVYSFAGYWPIELDCHQLYWRAQDGGVPGRLFRRMLAPLALSRLYRPVKAGDLRIDSAICCSRFVLDHLRDGGVALRNARVVFSGIDTERFHPAEHDSQPDTLRIVCLGGYARHKGALSIVDAMSRLGAADLAQVELTIIGHGHPEYRAELAGRVNALNLEGNVKLEDAIPRSEMPSYLRKYNCLVLATLTDEPLSRAVMEGMSTGLAVVATATGGTPEMICSGQDGLLYRPGDSADLASHFRSLIGDEGLRRQLGVEARKRAKRDFSRERMVGEIESFLEEIVTGKMKAHG